MKLLSVSPLSRRAWLLLLLVFAALLPALLLRELNTRNELNYLSIAADALQRGSLFAFYLEGVPYSDKPPAYLWLAMVNYKIMGVHGFFLLLCSALPFVWLTGRLAAFCGRRLGADIQVPLILGCCALPFMLGLALVARMDMLFTALIVQSCLYLIERLECLRRGETVLPHTLMLGMVMFAGLFVKGPYALIFPPLSLLLLLCLSGERRLFFRLMSPAVWGVILGLCLLWALGVYLDGGREYLTELFVGQSVSRLSGKTGHPEPFYWFALRVWYLAAPAALPLLYLYWRDIREGWFRQRRHAGETFCAVMALCVLLIISLPASKLELYLLPALPPAAVYCVTALIRREGEHSRVLRLLLGLGLLPGLAVLPGVLVLLLQGSYPEVVSHPAVLAASALWTLGSACSLYYCVRYALLRALCCCGLTLPAVFLVLAWALPVINPYFSPGPTARAASAAIDAGASALICTDGFSKEHTLELYDPRFVVVDADLRSEQCRMAQKIAGKREQRRDPDLVQELLQEGGRFFGRWLWSPGPRPEDHGADTPAAH